MIEAPEPSREPGDHRSGRRMQGVVRQIGGWFVCIAVVAVLMLLAEVFWSWGSPNLFMFWAGMLYMKFARWSDRHWG